MTRDASVSLSGDDTGLPDEERALLDRARALIPLLAGRAPAAAGARKLSVETIAEYHRPAVRDPAAEAVRRAAGPVQHVFRIVEELTWGRASSAWVYAVLAEHQWIIAHTPEKAQIDVWGDDPGGRRVFAGATCGCQARRRGLAAERAISFSSGGHYAQWSSRRLPRRDGRHAPRRLFPGAARRGRDRRRLAGAWLAGTGSKSLAVPRAVAIRVTALPGNHQEAAPPIGIGQRDEQAAVLRGQCIEPDRRKMAHPGIDDDGVGRAVGTERKPVGHYDRGLRPSSARFSPARAARAGSISIAVTRPARPTISARIAL